MIRNILRSIAFLLAITMPSLSHAQSKTTISGTVYEASADLTIAGAHVFLNGTTLGTITNENGHFLIEDVPDGVFQLVVKFLGFQDYVLQLNTQENTDDLEIFLKENVYKMSEITVTSDRKEWKERFDLFRSQFLGTSENAGDSEIKNPEVLNFDVDPRTNILTAEAYESLKIDNEALGYDIEFYLEHFAYNIRGGNSAYFGFPVYKEKESRRRRTNRRWNRNREKTYHGSFQHFISTLLKGNYYEEGFQIRAEMRKSRQDLMKEQADSTAVNLDSVYTENKIHGGGARYLSRDTVAIQDIFYQKDENTYVLKFINFLNVTYTKEKESYAFRKWNEGKFAEKNPEITFPQNSVMTLSADSLLIDKSGYIYNPTGYLLGRYWSFERLSDLMPIDYKID